MSREQWNYVFFMNAGVFVFAAVVFVLLGTGEPQSWAMDTKVVHVADNSTDAHVGDHEHVNESYVADTDEITHI